MEEKKIREILNIISSAKSWSPDMNPYDIATKMILDLLSQSKKDVIEALPKKQEHRFTCIKYQGQSAMCDCTAEGYNLALDDILLSLKDKEK